ncbi:MAG TPA: DUF3486 family protein [Hyphomicrobiales bacterium]|nr:DUF3486 family protein [Kaistiaceae bacterium]HQF30075.1 DUF3486 family protein [Hyphomicrobiales bacterium]
MAENREGRGRLSSIDLLPEEAGDDIIWALSELNKRERTQADILFELNDRLAVKGLGPISKSAFNRQSMKMAARARRIAERQTVYAGIAEQLTPDSVSATDRVLGEFLKTLIDELIDDPTIGARQAMELARAFQATVSALKTSSEHKAALMKEAGKKTEAAVNAVADAAAADGRSISAEEILQKIREVYGIGS